jgi:hypothetical protein
VDRSRQIGEANAAAKRPALLLPQLKACKRRIGWTFLSGIPQRDVAARHRITSYLGRFLELSVFGT